VSDPAIQRRSFLGKLAAAVLGLASLPAAWILGRSLVPNVHYEAPRRYKVGRPDVFPEGVSFLEERRLFVVRERNAFHAISAICTHLGCTVKYAPFRHKREMAVRGLSYTSRGEFVCPCHGSRFRDEGTNFTGPAPRPLVWYHMDVAPEDGQLRIDTGREVDRDFRLTV